MESAGGGWNVAAADGVRHPFGVPRLRWFRLQGLRYRSTACLWSCHPYGVYPELAYNTLEQRCITLLGKGV